ncbi:hypothetical protein [Paenisporosarcina sp. TG-14]|nr:hypothetical protein [Paenisporosarcina sp. TG-14]
MIHHLIATPISTIINYYVYSRFTYPSIPTIGMVTPALLSMPIFNGIWS